MSASLGYICSLGLLLQNEDGSFILHHPLCPVSSLTGCAQAGEHQHMGSPQGIGVCQKGLCI